MSYQGWTNYETWAVKLWMDNEEPSYRHWTDRAETAHEAISHRIPGATLHDIPVHNLADEVKEWVQENAPEVQGMYSDLLQGAIGSVNYHEIAESLLETAQENAEV